MRRGRQSICLCHRQPFEHTSRNGLRSTVSLQPLPAPLCVFRRRQSGYPTRLCATWGAFACFRSTSHPGRPPSEPHLDSPIVCRSRSWRRRRHRVCGSSRRTAGLPLAWVGACFDGLLRLLLRHIVHMQALRVVLRPLQPESRLPAIDQQQPKLHPACQSIALLTSSPIPSPLASNTCSSNPAKPPPPPFLFFLFLSHNPKEWGDCHTAKREPHVRHLAGISSLNDRRLTDISSFTGISGRAPVPFAVTALQGAPAQHPPNPAPRSHARITWSPPPARLSQTSRSSAS
jgi:hypothetical protein